MSDEDRIRDDIVRTARSLIGAHYLAGTFGQCPPHSDDATTASIAPLAQQGRTVIFWTKREWRDLMVRAAMINPYRGATLRCCGRYAAYANLPYQQVKLDLSQRLPPTPASTPPARLRGFYDWFNRISTLRPNAPTEAFRDPAFGARDYYPRRHCTEGSDARFVYLGEDCHGKMHFDCVGFVFYVFARVLHRPKYFDLPRSGLGRWTEVGTDQSNLTSCQRGDLFLSADHVAIVASSSNLRLIHANGDQRGVEETPFNVRESPSTSTWRNNFHVINLSRRFLGLPDDPH
ncbi:MAG: C40 family peptidase [Pirellulaceae bacterium]|jgi:cell wall-associated NlpC family hydrolase|nr:C40 family peptidase [Pirellulaceae bacterium]